MYTVPQRGLNFGWYVWDARLLASKRNGWNILIISSSVISLSFRKWASDGENEKSQSDVIAKRDACGTVASISAVSTTLVMPKQGCGNQWGRNRKGACALIVTLTCWVWLAGMGVEGRKIWASVAVTCTRVASSEHHVFRGEIPIRLVGRSKTIFWCFCAECLVIWLRLAKHFLAIKVVKKVVGDGIWLDDWARGSILCAVCLSVYRIASERERERKRDSRAELSWLDSSIGSPLDRIGVESHASVSVWGRRRRASKFWIID